MRDASTYDFTEIARLVAVLCKLRVFEVGNVCFCMTGGDQPTHSNFQHTYRILTLTVQK